MILLLQLFAPPKSPKNTKAIQWFRNTAPAPTATTNDAGVRFRQKLIYLQSLKLNLDKALTLNPNVRTAPISVLRSVPECLSSMGFDSYSIGRILNMFPELLTADPYDDVYPIFDFLLHNVEIPFPEIRKSVNRCPRILVSDLETQLKPALAFLAELGFVGPNKLTSRTTLLLVYSVEATLMPKIEYFLGLGIEYGDVKNMVLRLPALLTYSLEHNCMPKVEYLLKEMNGSVDELKRFPQYFGFSLDGRIKPRHLILMEHRIMMQLSEMLLCSDGEFTVQVIEKRLAMADKCLL